MAKEIFAGKKDKKYKIIISGNAISKKNLSPLIKHHNKALIISDNGVPFNLRKKVTSISKNFSKVFSVILTKGEQAKSIQNFQKILNLLANYNFDRTDVIIAIGGGVVGDIAGYVASSYLRGVQFIQIPTTLLAQVDSSVGGKTAINIPAGKNLVGAFYNPKGVVIDTSVLASLPEREYRSGLAEVLKYALIKNKYLFNLMKENARRILLMNEKIIEDVIYESIKTKAEIVTKDEKENGIRAILNFGHTFGHAIEAHGKYNKILHGEAVAKGMLIASKISHLEGHISKRYLNAIQDLLEMYKFDLSSSQYQYEDLKPFIFRDKKVRSGKLNIVLLGGPSKAIITSSFNSNNLKESLDN